MPELGSLGSVRGAVSNERPYRESKIKTAFVFGIIDAELRDEFDRIREIRNAFAHSRVAITFETPAVKKACADLFRQKGQTIVPPRDAYSKTALFLLSVGALALQQAVDAKRSRFLPPISYGEARTSFEKLLLQLPPQIQQNLPEGSIELTLPAPPESSPA